MDFSTDQLKAIDYCTDIKRRVVGVSGPAGTGKTTIMREAVKYLRQRNRRVVLAAPTGRAARRIYEATGFESRTIHKLLEYGKPEVNAETGEPLYVTRPGRHKEKPLDFIDVFVDEFMMVNEELYRNLMDALPPGGRLLAFGDVAQLPPIEPYEIKTVEGAPFERLLRLPSSVVLDTVYRQSEGSGLLENARRIRAGTSPVKRDDFSIRIGDYPLKDLSDHLSNASSLGMDYSVVGTQLITPTRSGPLGVYALNDLMQSKYYKGSGGGVRLPREKWLEKREITTTVHIGEKVICNENIYDLRDFFERFREWEDGSHPVWSTYIPCPDSFMILNGEIGVITEILPNGSLDVDVGDRVVHIPSSYRDYIPKFNRVYVRDPRVKLDLAYAVTTHKMQGSECEHVCYIMHRSISYATNRNNLYTGITRARKSVHLISDMSSITSVVKRTAKQQQDARYKAKHEGWSIEI